MELIGAINRVDALKPNTYSQNDKLQWLSDLDLRVKTQIMDLYEGNGAANFAGYTDKTPVNTVLLVPAPYDEMYLRWLEAKIDYYNNENDRYNNAMALFDELFEAFKKHYARGRKACGAGQRFLF